MSNYDSPLTSALDGMWLTPFAELPLDLQRRVGPTTNRVFVGYQPKFNTDGTLSSDPAGHVPVYEKCYSENLIGGFFPSWDSLSPTQRRAVAEQIDRQQQVDPDADDYYWDLLCQKHEVEIKIQELTLSNHRNVPSEILIRNDNIERLSTELNAIKRKFHESVPHPKAADHSAGDRRAMPVSSQNQNLILQWLKEHGYDPQCVPVPSPGKSGVRKHCRDSVTKKQMTASAFERAWQGLRDNELIKDAPSI